MKTLFSVVLLCAFSLAASAQRTCRVEGTLPNDTYDGRYICLDWQHAVAADSIVRLDSVMVTGDRFVIEGIDASEPHILHLRFGTTAPSDIYATHDNIFVAEPGTVTVSIDSVGATLGGTPLNTELSNRLFTHEQALRKQQWSLNGRRNAMQANGQLLQEENERINAQLRDAFAEYMQHHAEAVEHFLDVAPEVGNALYFRYMPDSYPEAMRSRLKAAADQDMMALWQRRMDERQVRQQRFQASQQAMDIGGEWREVEGIDPDGNALRFSDLIHPGRPMLLVFWASWCGPCRQEIPFLRDLWTKYHDRGLDMVSFSVDKTREAWLKALQKEQPMPWPQLSDLKAWNSPAVLDYGIQAIPFVLLFDKHGRIAVRNLHDKLLVEAIEKALEQ